MAREPRAHERASFASTARDVRATLGAVLRGNVDFVASLRAVLAMAPHLSASGFDRWFAALDGRARQIGSLGTNVVVPVTPAQLAGFLARRNADPAFRSLVGGHLAPVAPTSATRCLLSAGTAPVPFGPVIARVIQGDWCTRSSPVGTTETTLLAIARDTGSTLIYPVNVLSAPTALAEVAIHRPGAPLDTVAQRRAALVGWLTDSLDMGAMLRSAIGRHPLAVSLYHANPGRAPVPVDRLRRGGAAHGPFETSARLDVDHGAWTVVELKALGVRIAIDDFGTGYSSLAYLRQFPVDAIKIDRSFVGAVATSRESLALVPILVRLGKALHLETLAEGIEEHGQLRALQRQRCDRGQGFLFARPLEALDAEALIARGAAATDAPAPSRPTFSAQLEATG